MRHDVRVFADGIEQSWRHIGRFERTQPYSRTSYLVLPPSSVVRRAASSEAVEQIGEVVVAFFGPVSSSDGVLAVRSEKNTGDDYFSMSGFYKGLRFVEDLGQRFAANKRPGFGNNTVGAVPVAAVLDLEKSPGLALERRYARQGIFDPRSGPRTSFRFSICDLRHGIGNFFLAFVVEFCFNSVSRA